MKQFILIFLSAVTLLVNVNFLSAQSHNSSANEPDFIVFLLDRLEQIANQAEPLYKKAKEGNVKTRKQLLDVYGEGQVIVDVLKTYDYLLSDAQSEQMRYCIEKTPRASDEEDEIFLEGLAPDIVDEKLKILDKQADRMVKLIRQMQEGNHTIKDKLMVSAIEVAKLQNIIGFFELTAKQTQKEEQIAGKINNVSYDGQVITSENVFRLLLGNPDRASDDLVDIDHHKHNNQTEVDEFIDQYELYMEEMMSVVKRMRNGDPDAQQEYDVLTRKIYTFYENSSALMTEFTPEQMQRLQQIAGRAIAEVDNPSGIDIADLEDNTSKNDNQDLEEILSECSAILDEYESWVDQYIAIYPKLIAGEQQAVEEMQDMTEKIQAISEIMSNCSSKYSTEDIERIQKIADKLTKVFSSDGN